MIAQGLAEQGGVGEVRAMRPVRVHVQWLLLLFRESQVRDLGDKGTSLTLPLVLRSVVCTGSWHSSKRQRSLQEGTEQLEALYLHTCRHSESTSLVSCAGRGGRAGPPE